MKIAIISSNTLPTPPFDIEVPAGWTTSIHQVISNITEGLVRRGCDVTLFASGDSTTGAKLESVWDKCSMKHELLSDQFSYCSYDHILTSLCFERSKTENYDIIYTFHTFDSGFFANLISTPIVSAYHGSGAWNFEHIWPNKIIKPNHYVAISEFQKNNCTFLNFDDVIHNGIDPDVFKFKEKNANNKMIFVGRVCTTKGADIAAQISSELNTDLDIFGTASHPSIIETIKNFGPTIHLHGQRTQKEIATAIASAKLFIFPLRWNEPFGLVLAEALACGTPIIGFANGSLPEIIQDGETGFLVNPGSESIQENRIIEKTGNEGIKEAIRRIYTMPESQYLRMRKLCQARFEQNFTREIMIEKYITLFNKIIKKNENLHNHHDL